MSSVSTPQMHLFVSSKLSCKNMSDNNRVTMKRPVPAGLIRRAMQVRLKCILKAR